MKSDKSKYRWIIIVALLGVLIFWGATFLLFYSKESFRGPFGDMFGAVNALFSGLAFAGIILSMYMQRDDLRHQKEELALQREELILQRKEQKETREVFEKQSQIMDDQQNDSAFFNLLTNHRQLVESFKTSRWRFRSKNSSSAEIVSGYQVVEETADSWADFFYEYSEMYQSKVIWNIHASDTTPTELVLLDRNIQTLVEETVHLSQFITDRFKDEQEFKFYKETLSHNLLNAEKFIVAAWYALKLNNETSSPFGMELFENENYIDFNIDSLPKVSININFSNVANNCIEFSTSGMVQSYYFVIDHEPSKSGERNIEATPIHLEEGLSELSISIQDFARDTSLNIQSFPFEQEKLHGLSQRDFYIVVEVAHENEVFRVPWQIYLREREDYDARINEMKFYNLTLERSNSYNLSIEMAVDLVQHITKA